MRKNILIVILVIIAAAAAVVLINRPRSVDLPTGEGPGGPRYGGTLVYGCGADAAQLDPANVVDGESLKVVAQMFDGLVKYKLGSTEIEPGLATSWESSDDGLTWVFNLREGVKFHDGTPFDADAVVFSFMRQIDPNHPYHDGEFPIFQGVLASHIKGARALGKYKIEISMHHAYAPVLSALATATMGIISPAAMKELGHEGFAKHGVGTGEFKFVEWLAGNRIVLEANEDYWGGRPYLDRVVFRVVESNTIRALQLESGAIDIMDGLDPASVEKIKRNPDLKILVTPGLSVGFMAMNCEKEPFTDKRVRQAINYAINKEPLVKLIYQGLATSAKNPMPPTLWGYNDDIEPYAYSPNKARELLAQAGYPDGFSFTLDVMENPRPYMPEPVKVAEAIKANLSVVGIDVRLRINKWKDHLQRVLRSPETDYEAAFLGWYADVPDPNDFLYVLLSKDTAVKENMHTNIALYRSDEYDDLVVRASKIADQKERERFYREAQEIFHEDAPWVPLAHGVATLAHNKRVQNLVIDPREIHQFIRVWVKE